MIVRTARRRRQSGFAMLLVFLMAAVVALMLYMEIPRMAMEVQRNREQMLVDRGEQYKRAITVFWKENKRYPTKMEELETLNNRHWLRRRYRDPMTGKDEWRLIHIQNGFLTDSLVNKTGTGQNNSATAGDNFKWGTGMGDPTASGNGTPAVNLANRRRASDGQPAGLGDGQAAVTDPNNPNQPVANPGVAGMQPGSQPGGQPGMPGMPQMPGTVNGQQIPGMPGVPTQAAVNPATGQPCSPAQPCPGAGDPNQNPGQNPTLSQPFPNPNPFAGGQAPPFTPGQPVNSQIGGVSPSQGGFQYGGGMTSSGQPTYPQPGAAIPGQGAPTGPNQAQQMIQQILTSPRPGGFPGVQPGQPGQQQAGAVQAGSGFGGGPGVGSGGGIGSGFGSNQQVVGAGIAGVASTADGDAIKVYNDHTNYKEWEFVFTIDKLKIPPNPLSAGPAAGTPASQLGSTGGTNIGTPASDLGSGFGQTPGTGPGGQPQMPGGMGQMPGQMPGMGQGTGPRR